MRVLVVTNMYPPHAYGGYEQSCRDVVQRWRAAGHQVLVLTGDIRVAGVADVPEEPAAVRRQLRLYWEDHRILDPSPPRRLVMERANRRAFDRAVADHRPDVVSAWAMGALSLGILTRAAALGLPVVPVVCDEWPVYGPEVDAWLRPLWRRRGLARLLQAATGLHTGLPPLDTAGPACFVSDHLRTVVRRGSPWRFPDSTVVYSGIAGAEFPPRPAHPAWGWRLAYVGRIDPRKGIDTVVRALALLPGSASLAVHGSGDRRHQQELQALARQLQVADRITWQVTPRHRLADALADVDAVVFPSVWEEPFGLVPLEAMSCGVPVAATAVGGAAEFLADGHNCLTFPPGDPDGLARVLHRLAQDAPLRRRLVDAGRVTAAALDVDRLAEELTAWHRAAVAGPAAPRPAPRPLPGSTPTPVEPAG